MNFLRAYRYVFGSPKWTQNVLLSMLCLFVPVLGQIVLHGYHFDIIETMHLRGPDRYPDFDIARVLRYVMRGAWVFLVELVVGLPVNAALVVLVIAALVSNGFEQTSLTAALIVAAAFVALLGKLAVFVVSVPLLLRAGFMRDFGAAFQWPFVRDFLGKVGVETLLAGVFLGVTAPVIYLVGLLLLCVGVWPAAAWVSFAPPNLYHQLYELYLKRGGTAVPLKAG
jgi:hypothetical protein